jgi:hypothetical protein
MHHLAILFEPRFEQPKMQHFLMIYSDLIKKNYESTKNFVKIEKTLFKITLTLKIDLVFEYMLSTKILLQLAI